jgi:ABC-2 type transport system permease protein
MTPQRAARLFWASLVFHLKGLAQSSFFLVIGVITPVVLATIAFYLFRSGAQEETLLYAALGAGLMGIWATTLFGSGGAIQWQRWQGTLELLIAAPVPFIAVLVPLTVATSAYGLVSLVSTLVWGRVLFGIELELVHPVLFFVALPSAVIGLGLLGLLLASTFVLYRNANALSNFLGEPVWLITGMLVPVSLLPGFVEPLSWILAPTWGVRAIREAALGGEPLPAIGMCLGLGVVYALIAALCLRYFERAARARATLALT